MTVLDDRPANSLTLAAVPSAVNLTRMLIEHDLRICTSDKAFINRVGLVAEELARHAVATTGFAKEGPFYPDAYFSSKLQTIVVQVRMIPDHAVVAVWDRGTRPPARQLKDVPAIASAAFWNYEVQPPNRRVVWCGVPTLPRRVPGRVPPPTDPVVGSHDYELLERVRDLLRGLR